jgi:hypothetical protein
LPRDLGDVIHHFLPPSGAPAVGTESDPVSPIETPAPRTDRPAALPIVALPVGERDVVRAAYAWNLSVEVARHGASATLLAPASSDSSLLWPEPGRGPVGAEAVLSPAQDLSELNHAALDLAVNRAADTTEGGVILACVPPSWIPQASDGCALLRWVVLFTSPEMRELRETYALVKRIVAINCNARVGITVHGVRRVGDAEAAFSRLAGITARHLAHSLESYGLLVDDLHVYRAIVSRRPIGLEHPQSRAARALRDVARLLLEDAEVRAVA